jgi:sensor domain CHASE-containing protein
MNRKIFGNVLATAFLAGALAACSSSSSEQTEEQQAQAEQEEAEQAEAQEQQKGDDRTSTSAWWGDNLAGYWYVLKRDMKQLYQSIDRHVFNYDWEDPYLN